MKGLKTYLNEKTVLTACAPETRLFPSTKDSHIVPQGGNPFCLS